MKKCAEQKIDDKEQRTQENVSKLGGLGPSADCCGSSSCIITYYCQLTPFH